MGCLPCRQLLEDMSKYRGELSEREKDLLLIRRASGAKASQLAQMEKMLQETKGMLDKKNETGTDKKTCGDTMGLYHSLLFSLMLLHPDTLKPWYLLKNIAPGLKFQSKLLLDFLPKM